MEQTAFKEHLEKNIIPFWNQLIDRENGGFCGFVGSDLEKNFKADKGVILHSRILWFYANAYTLLGKLELLEMADHVYAFLKEKCVDSVNGGIYWSMTYDGKPADDIKHTYNQAFCIYALSSYYEAGKKEEVKALAMSFYRLIETKCRNEGGYLEAFERDFRPASNEKLSENGVMATRTMNTLLHVLEAYTELYRVTGDENVKKSLTNALELFYEKIYDKETGSCKVFFDEDYHSLIDLESYGHNIEASWLLDRALEVIWGGAFGAGVVKEAQSENQALQQKYADMTATLAKVAYEHAYDAIQQGFNNEREYEKVDNQKIWWVQAEAVIGLYNAYQKDTTQKQYLDGAEAIWNFILEKVVDKRCGEWFESIKADGSTDPEQGLVHAWKCPYHNGRMCIEMIKRLKMD